MVLIWIRKIHRSNLLMTDSLLGSLASKSRLNEKMCPAVEQKKLSLISLMKNIFFSQEHNWL
ncbi:hypothetical protein VAEU17_250082 [Vibrio aestuarianus]|nr:hypothetical protein VAEU17_250082 [Vibrio aestuarianus]